MATHIPGFPPRATPLTVGAIWRAGAPEFDVDAFVARHPELEEVDVFRRGELGRRGHVVPESGFCLELASAEPFDRLLEETLAALPPLEPALRELRELGVESEIDFGMLVGVQGGFTRSAHIPPSALRRFAELGITLVVSSYPSRDGT